MSQVLIVYTDPASTDVPAIVCDDAGLTVAFSPELEAAAALESEAFNLVIACVQKPLTLLRAISSATKRTPVIVVMNDAGGLDNDALHAAGAKAIIFRSFSIQTLRRAVTDLVQTPLILETSQTQLPDGNWSLT